jgi:hypothetical protein
MLPKKDREAGLHERKLRVEVVFASHPTKVEKALLVCASEDFKTDLISIHAVSIENSLKCRTGAREGEKALA